MVREYEEASDAAAVRRAFIELQDFERVIALLEAAEARAREAGADCVRLSVKAGNAGARSLYAAEGYEATDIYLEKKLT